MTGDQAGTDFSKSSTDWILKLFPEVSGGIVSRAGAIQHNGSGRSVAWLARLLGVQEVESSNLSAPTIFIKKDKD